MAFLVNFLQLGVQQILNRGELVLRALHCQHQLGRFDLQLYGVAVLCALE